MKKLLLLLICLILLTGRGFSQEVLKIGEIRDGKFQITNEKALKAYFLDCLGYSGSLGKDISIEPSPEGDRYYVTVSVTGNKDLVSSIGVLLVKKDKEVVIMEAKRDPEGGDGPGIGGSMNVKCSGEPCSVCIPELEWVQGQWYPLVRCKCYDPGGKCNSVISFTIKLNVGF
jgi:hypothetical protein